MDTYRLKSLAARYAIGTTGLALVAIGVALSIKSDLGTAPVSCPPYVVSLATGQSQIGAFEIGTVGQFTILMHFIFILLQMALLRNRFKAEHLMQIPAAIVFGVLTDAAIWAFEWISAETYVMKLVLLALSILITALGVSLEIMGNAWMLAGEMTDAAIADFFKIRFSTAKVAFDIFLVIVAAAVSIACFHNIFGDGTENVIREGTVMSALFTGLCMRFTDPIAAKLIPDRFRKMASGE